VAKVRRLDGRVATVALLVAALINWSGCLGLPRPGRGKPEEIKINPAVKINPSKEYRLEFWDYRLPIVTEDGSSYEDLVAGVIAAFRTLYPNVAIEYRLLSVSAGKEELEQALAAGAPPDVYGGLAELPVVNAKLQVPAGLYLDAEARAAYFPTALQAVTIAGEIWAWPRWISPRVWVGNADLLAAAGVNPAALSAGGWTRTEFEQAAARLPAVGGKAPYGLLVNDAGITAFEDILLNSAAAQPAVNGAGGVWNRAALADTFAWLDELRQQKILPAATTKMQSIILTAYWDGKVMAAAGLGPWLFGKEIERQQRRSAGLLPPTAETGAIATVLLPIPHSDGATSLVPLDIGSVTVFRQADYRGDDHTRAAAEFAAFFSQEMEWVIADRLFYLPARSAAAAAWLAAAPLSQANKQMYRRAAQSGFAWQAAEIGRGRPDREALQQLNGILAEFWSGNTEAAAAAEKAAEIIETDG